MHPATVGNLLWYQLKSFLTYSMDSLLMSLLGSIKPKVKSPLSRFSFCMLILVSFSVNHFACVCASILQFRQSTTVRSFLLNPQMCVRGGRQIETNLAVFQRPHLKKKKKQLYKTLNWQPFHVYIWASNFMFCRKINNTYA